MNPWVDPNIVPRNYAVYRAHTQNLKTTVSESRDGSDGGRKVFLHTSVISKSFYNKHVLLLWLEITVWKKKMF